MLATETAELFHFKSVGVIFLILDRVVVSLLALTASKCDFYSHIGTSVIFCEKSRLPLGKIAKFAQRGRLMITQREFFVKCFYFSG